ncbi:carbon storage regulator [Gemmatimonas sp.]|uniref:carbon storage regulator n=1 Tax=Gemmatimonas sp. TaxID=1962908 RepID=UPI00333ED0DD
MLILGRREGDSILIDGGIRIVVVSCDRGGVRIGIEAPSDVKILRGEIAQQVEQENQRAASASDAADWLAALGAPSAAAPVPSAVSPASGTEH